MKATEAGRAPAESLPLINGHCIVCGAGFQFPYGRHDVPGQNRRFSGTCSKACEDRLDELALARRNELAKRFLEKFEEAG